MGCTASSAKKTRTQTAEEAIPSHVSIYASVRKRSGYPSSYRDDGYEVGVRVRE